MAKSLKCGYRGHRNCSRLLERQIRRLHCHDLQGHCDELCESPETMIEEIGIDLVAGLELGNAAANGLHLPGNVTTDDPVFRP